MHDDAIVSNRSVSALREMKHDVTAMDTSHRVAVSNGPLQNVITNSEATTIFCYFCMGPEVIYRMRSSIKHTQNSGTTIIPVAERCMSGRQGLCRSVSSLQTRLQQLALASADDTCPTV